jgi:RNA polymerase sigma factor (sigma-70 family)
VVVGGDVSLEEAYRTWAGELTRYAAAIVGPSGAADLVADAFTVVLGRGDGAWSEVRDPRAYLYRSVMNAALMEARGAARRHRREMRWLAEPQRGQLLSDPSVRAALERLSVQQRAVTFLTYWHDMSPSTIASMLHISEGSVKRQLARARSTLREVLS